MLGPGVVIKGFDPPKALTAHVSSSTQNDPADLEPSIGRFDCPNKAVPAVAVAQFALAPLAFGGEQALHPGEFGQQVVLREIETVEGHFCTR